MKLKENNIFGTFAFELFSILFILPVISIVRLIVNKNHSINRCIFF